MTDPDALTVSLYDAIQEVEPTDSYDIIRAALPIMEAEVQAAKAEAWNEGCAAAEQYYKRTVVGVPGSDPIPAPVNPHEETP